MFDIGSVVGHIVLDAKDFEKGIKTAQDSTSNFQTGLIKTATVIKNKFTLPILAAATACVKFAADTESQRVALKVLLKDADKANKVFKEWQEFAASTPFQFDELAQSGKMLLAFGETAEGVTETLRRIGDVASGINQPITEIAEIYGKMRVQNTLYAQDLNQLAGRGIPVFSELAKVLGISQDKVKEFASTGQLKFESLQQAFKNLTSEGGQFFGMMEEQSKTTAGKFSTLIDNLKIMGVKIGEMLLPAVNKLMELLSGLIEIINKLPEPLRQFIVYAGILGAAGGPLVLFAKNLGTVFTVIKGLALKINPVVAAFVLLAGAVGAGVKEVMEMDKKVEELSKKFKLSKDEIVNFQRELNNLADQKTGVVALKDANEMAEIYGISLKELNDIAGLTGGKIEGFSKAVETSTPKVNALNTSTNQTVQAFVDAEDAMTRSQWMKHIEEIAQKNKNVTSEIQGSWGEVFFYLVNQWKESVLQFGFSSEKAKEDWGVMISKLQDGLDEVASHVMNVLNSITGMFSQMYQNQLTASDNRYKKEKKNIENSTMAEEQKKEKLAALEEKYQKEQAKLKKKQFEMNKKASFIEATINIATAVTKALTLGFPLGLIIAGMIGGLGAVQLGLIASQPTPEFAKGGIATPGLAIVGEEGPELVNMRSTSRIFPADETRGILGGGGVSINMTFTGDINSDVDIQRAMESAGRRFKALQRGA